MDEEKRDIDTPSDVVNTKSDTIKAIRKFADEDEADKSSDLTLRSVLGGDILQSRFMMRQIIFVMFLAVLIIVYTGNRYSSQQDAILIDEMQLELQTARYNVLTISSELTNLKRQSLIEKRMKDCGDSTLLKSTTQPFEIVN
ncbi:MAG: hypothetical protein MJY59_02740 [Bacteroidaceae bacterium]|nr:hypothetical protein [Bacteroidaceae bacterium]